MSDRTRIYTQGWFSSVPETSNSTSIYTEGWFTTSDIPPAAPTDLTALALSYTDVLITWINNSSSATGFRVERRVSGVGTWETVGTTTVPTTFLVDERVVPAVEYDYRVFAINSFGEASSDPLVGFSTSTPPLVPVPSPPGPPPVVPRNTLPPILLEYVSPGAVGGVKYQ